MKASDSGSYICNGITSEGASRDSINVVVKAQAASSPIVKKKSPPEIYIDHYRSVDVTFQWLKDSKVISNESVHILRNIKEEDEGTYSCVGDNQYGHDEEKFHLSVRQAESDINIVGENVPGGTAEIECAEGTAC